MKLLSFQRKENAMIKINNRRYIGNKTKLLEHIYENVPRSFVPEETVFADFFAGTGTVADFFAQKKFKIIVNDTLYSNYVAYMAWFSNLEFDIEVIEKYITFFNAIEGQNIEDNYFSEIYSGKYFSFNDAKKIGYIRDYIENIKGLIKEREYYILLSSLLYVTDKIANTVGHFEYFLKKPPVDSNFKMDLLDIKKNINSEIYNMDANELSKSIKCDIAYIDPPYNARQYVNFYHVLENLARWNKPRDFEGNSMKFKRDELKSGYSRSIAPQLFKDLIDSLDCKLILVSYNNTYSAKSVASNNKITEEQILEILEGKGKVTKKEIDYKFFNAGKTDFKEHKEFIFICEVTE